VKSYLEAVEIAVRRIDRLLPAADRPALREKIDPLLKRYRATKGRDDALLRRIVTAFRAYPAAWWSLLRDLRRIDPKRWKKPVAKGRAKIRKKARSPQKKAASRRIVKGSATVGRGVGYGSGVGRGAVRKAMDDSGGGGSAAPIPRMSAPAAAAPEPEKPRWIIAKASDLQGALSGKALRAFRASGEHEVKVHIGVEAKAGELIARATSARDSVVPEGESYDLEVGFIVPALGLTDRKPLHVPAYGDSNRVTFRFRAGEAGSEVQAFVTLSHGSRLLQTAVLAGSVVADPAKAPDRAELTLRLQIVVPSLSEATKREPFDAAVLDIGRPGGRAAAAGIGAGGVVVFDSPALDDAGADVRSAIKMVVSQPQNFRRPLKNEADHPAVKLLWELAQYGVQLHDAIGAKLDKSLAKDGLKRLQIVQSDPNAFIPLEFVYDLPAPANGAKLCGTWQDALAGKPCPKHKEDGLGNLECICPAGFWGISKVIERHVLKEVEAEELRLGRGFGIRSEPTEERPDLPPPSSAVFGWSDILDNLVGTTSQDLLKALNDATAGQAQPVKTWLAWGEAIKTRPALLVLLSHTITTQGPLAIQIGPPKGGEKRTIAQITEKVVRRDDAHKPIVILLGCDTAAESELTTFVGRFRHQGAAVVVGTITPVLGEHSAKVVRALLAKLAKAAASDDAPRPRFGELMRDVRRELLAEGELTALCATSFGDADWGIGRAA
jgi:hypothetical protein